MNICDSITAAISSNPVLTAVIPDVPLCCRWDHAGEGARSNNLKRKETRRRETKLTALGMSNNLPFVAPSAAVGFNIDPGDSK